MRCDMRNLNGNGEIDNHGDIMRDADAAENDGSRAPEDDIILEEPKKKKSKPPKAAIAVVVVAVVAVAGLLGYFYLGNGIGATALGADEEMYFQDDGKIFSGVSVMDVDLSGMTQQAAAEAVNAAAQQMLDELSVKYTVEGKEYTVESGVMGASYDTVAAVAQAVAYGREGDFFGRLDAVDQAEESGYDIPVEVRFDEQSVHDSITANPDLKTLAAVDAQDEMKKVSDEDKKITDMEITFTDESPGKEVNEEKLISDIYNNIMAGSFETVEAEMVTVEPEVTKEDLEKLYTERGVFSTKYSSSADG
jgi:hypothetical protein